MPMHGDRIGCGLGEKSDIWDFSFASARLAATHKGNSNPMLALATKVVRDYGKVLAAVVPGVHGLPESLLPHSKEQIRSAIAMLLENLEPEHTALKESLARGYVYLA